MKRTLLIAFAIVVMCSLGTAQNSQNVSGANKDLQKRFHEYADALAKKDVAALDKLWMDDYTFINPHGELITKSQRIANLKSGATEFQSVTPRPEQLHIHGNVAIDIGSVALQGTKYGGQESSGVYRYTNVWVRTGTNWQLLSNQVTLIKK